MVKLLALFTRRERWQIAGLMVAFVAMGLLQVASIGAIAPFLNMLVDPEAVRTNPALAWAYDVLGFGSERAFLLFVGSMVLVVLLISNGFNALTIWLLQRFSWGRMHTLSTRLLRRYLSQPYVTFLDRSSASTGKNILAEVMQLTQNVLVQYLQLIAGAATALAILGFLLWFNPLLSLATAVVLGGAYAAVYLAVRRKLDRTGRVRLEANTERFKQVNEAFGAIKDVKLMGKEASFVAQFVPASLRFSRANVVQSVLAEVPRYAFEGVAFGGIMLLLLLLLAMKGDVRQVIPVAGVFAFGTYRMLPALQRGFAAMSKIRFNGAVLETIYADLVEGTREEALQQASSVPMPRLALRDAIRLEDVSFSYPNASQPALRDITLSIPRGGSVALVGPTGAGKTTLVDVLLGLLRPQHGRVTVDGVELDDTNLRAWQNNLGYVPQHIYLSDDTVARNIAFGVPPERIDRDAVERAARIANIHDFVTEELPKAYDTVVGERGVRLSGGQRQRIGIARALYHDPEVLVLDEATSNLDAVTEAAVQQAIAQVAGAKTLVVIAHRLTTVRGCDVVYLLERGRIVARGTYDELLTTSAGFRAMAGVGK